MQYIYMYVCICIYVYIYVCLYIQTHIYTYIHIYIHIYTYIYIYIKILLHYVGLFCHYAWPFFLTIFGEICMVLHNNT